MSAPAGPRLSWRAFLAVMVPFLIVLGFFMTTLR